MMKALPKFLLSKKSKNINHLFFKDNNLVIELRQQKQATGGKENGSREAEQIQRSVDGSFLALVQQTN